MNPAMFLCQPDVFNYVPPPNIWNLAKPAPTFGPSVSLSLGPTSLHQPFISKPMGVSREM